MGYSLEISIKIPINTTMVVNITTKATNPEVILTKYIN